MDTYQLFTGASTNGYHSNPTTVDPIAYNLDTQAFRYANQVYGESQTIWDREDSAYQRMVEDMKKAGLNPWTGISSGGSSTSGVLPTQNALNSLISTLGAISSYEESNSRLWKNSADTVGKIFQTGLGIAGRLIATMA